MLDLDGTLNDQQLEQDTLEQAKIQGDKPEPLETNRRKKLTSFRNHSKGPDITKEKKFKKSEKNP